MSKEKDKEKKLSDYEKVYKNFKENYDNSELQIRFDGMVVSEKKLNDRINQLIATYNSELKKELELQEIIFKSAILEIIDSNTIKKYKELNAKNAEIFAEISTLQSKHRGEIELIEKYKDWSSKKLFQYWSILKDLDETLPHWTEWKRPFENRIF